MLGLSKDARSDFHTIPTLYSINPCSLCANDLCALCYICSLTHHLVLCVQQHVCDNEYTYTSVHTEPEKGPSSTTKKLKFSDFPSEVYHKQIKKCTEKIQAKSDFYHQKPQNRILLQKKIFLHKQNKTLPQKTQNYYKK